MKQNAEDLEQHISLFEHGWKLYPANATEEEQVAAIEAYIDGGNPIWYPGGYVEERVITEGKLKP